MSTTTVQTEIQALEDRLIQAELGPDPAFFQKYLDERAVMVKKPEDWRIVSGTVS